MELAATLVLSVVGGYAFASHWRFTAFATRRTEGHHLYFRAAFYGTVFFISALLIRLWLLATFPYYDQLESELGTYIAPALKEPRNSRQVELVITAVFSLFLGPLFAVVLNILSPRDWGLRRSFSALDALMFRAQRADMPVCITLNTGKAYIGLVVRITDPDHPPPSITMLPMFSGFRNDQGRLKLTTDYAAVYKELAREPEKIKDLKLPSVLREVFEMIIRADTIVSATMFSPAIYAKFNPDWRESISAKSQPAEFIVQLKRAAPVTP
jgi:hypothetical protein